MAESRDTAPEAAMPEVATPELATSQLATPQRERTDTTALVAAVAAESEPSLRLQPFDVSATTAGLAAALVLLVAAAAFVLAVWTRRWRDRPGLAERESRNGDALLYLAREIEAHVVQLERAGRFAGEQRRWARLCRRIAGEHLECVNALLLESLRREAARPPPDRR